MDQSVYEDWLYLVNSKRKECESLKVMELACGTGKVAVQLALDGHDVTGVDLSDDMLAIAYDLMQTEGVNLQLIQADMRELDEIDSFDMVTCFSDSLCYLFEEEELEQVFQGVYQNLTTDGTFLFDVHSLYQMTDIFPGYQYIYQDEDEAFLWESFGLEEEHAVEHILTFFVADEDGRFERLQEVHEERSFPIEVYKALLEKVGFKNIEVTADFGRASIDDTTTRWFFSAQK